MSLILTISILVLIAYLLIVAALDFSGSRLSKFELKRRKDLGDKEAEDVLGREEALADLVSLRQFMINIVIVFIALLAVTNFGLLLGLIIVLVVIFIYPSASNLKSLKSLSSRLFEKQKQHIFKMLNKYSKVIKILRSGFISDTKDRQVSSRQELQHIVDESVGVLSGDEKKLIVNGLAFADKQVKEIMTPKSMIDSIKSGEFLGPLVLNDLHAKGHSRLPVIKNDIDHVVGILNIKNLLSLDEKRSVTAEKAMDAKVYYIRHDQNLQHALSAFIKTHQQIFIVVNEYRETVGLLTLEDVIEALLGRKIVDEFDGHDNLREVALRNPHLNNHPRLREDV
ncbi:MAG: CBS domain-containing protein [Thiobacillus sp.]